MIKQVQILGRFLAIVYCLFCNFVAAKTPICEDAHSNLILVTSSWQENEEEAKLIRKNVIYSLNADNTEIIKKMLNSTDDELKKASAEFCSKYIQAPNLEDMNALLELLNCRYHKEDRKLIMKDGSKFELSNNYKVSPVWLFFLGKVSKDIDLANLASKIDNLNFSNHIIEDYTDILMGKMPAEIVKEYSNNYYSLLEEQLNKGIQNINSNSQIELSFFYSAVLAYKKVIKKCIPSFYLEELISTYNNLWRYIYSSVEDKYKKDLVYLNEALMAEVVEKLHYDASHPSKFLDKILGNYKYKKAENKDFKSNVLDNLNILSRLVNRVSSSDLNRSSLCLSIEGTLCRSLFKVINLLPEGILNSLQLFKIFLIASNG